MCILGFGITPRPTKLTFERTANADKFVARYATAFEFVLDLKASFRKDAAESERDIIDKYARPKLLILDEFEVRGETQFEDNAILHLIDRRYREGRSTIILANLSRDEMAAALGRSALSRMAETGGIVETDWPSFRKPKTKRENV